MGLAKDIDIDVLSRVVKKSLSIREVLVHFGLPDAGGNYQTFKSVCAINGIDYSHFDGKAKSNHGSWNSVPIEDILKKGVKYKSSTLRKRLLRLGMIDNKCLECGMPPVWNGKEITLELDHINGDNQDNRLENLRLLCPNCHSQTSTFRGRGIKRSRLKNRCSDCGKGISRKASRCKSCVCKRRPKKVSNRPLQHELKEMIATMSWCAIGRKYGISDNAVRKWAKSYGLI